MKPTTVSVNDLKDLIATRLDVVEFLDIIGFDMFDLVEALEEVIDEYSEELYAACE